jgi:uncharacterized protein YecE (DUF72 family)
MSRVYIGTSGWHYASWRGRFFPSELMLKHRLQYYATQFDTTELNGVFYRTPTLEAVRAWREQTPDDFVFAWKASKFITHWKRLSGKSRNSVALMETRLRALGEKAGPVLFQLPPRFTANRDRLASFIKLLKKRRPLCFRVPARELVRGLDSRPPARPRHGAVSVRSSRCAGTLDRDGTSCLCARARSGRALSWSLSRQDAAGMDARYSKVETTTARCLCLLRQ